MKARIKIKLIILVFIVFAYKVFGQTLSPLVANKLAINQMYHTLDSSITVTN